MQRFTAKAEKGKPMDDLIRGRKNALFEWKREFREVINELYLPRDDYHRVMGFISDVPSEHGKGHWIDTNPEEPLDPRQTCSECGNTEILHSAKFCPNCGADMRGEADGENS